VQFVSRNPEPGTQNPEPLTRIRFKCQRTSHPPSLGGGGKEQRER